MCARLLADDGFVGGLINDDSLNLDTQNEAAIDAND